MLFQSAILVVLFGFSHQRDIPSSAELWIRPATSPIQNHFQDDTRISLPKGFYEQKSVLDSIRMPGTKWCGKGWRTDTFNNLGGYSSADRCCRQHDLACSESIQPGETKHGLHNGRIHTVMHCSCDDRFRTCLKMSKTSSANTVGKLFFNVFLTPCYVVTEKEECTEYTWWGKCKTFDVVKRATWRKPVRF